MNKSNFKIKLLLVGIANGIVATTIRHLLDIEIFSTDWFIMWLGILCLHTSIILLSEIIHDK